MYIVYPSNAHLQSHLQGLTVSGCEQIYFPGFSNNRHKVYKAIHIISSEDTEHLFVIPLQKWIGTILPRCYQKNSLQNDLAVKK